MKTINFLAESNRIEKLEKLKDSLVRLNESVEWEGMLKTESWNGQRGIDR